MKEQEFVSQVQAVKAEVAEESLATKFKNALTDCLMNPVSRYCTLACAFRFLTIFTCDYYLPAYFL